MSASYLRLTKSETRELVERESRARSGLRLGEPSAWRSDSSWFGAFVVLALLAALAALAMR